MVEKRMESLLLWILICITISLVSSLTLPFQVSKPPKHKHINVTANGTKGVNIAATTATTGLVLYKVTASNGATCILLRVDGLIEVYFNSNIGQDKVDKYMIEEAIVEGNCKYEDTASMRIQWEGYTMIWNFAKTPGGERWYVSQLELTVSTEDEKYHSVRSYVLPQKSFKLVHSQMLFPTPVGKSFACVEEVVTLAYPEDDFNPVGFSGKLFLRTFQLQPFMYKGSNFGPTFDCNAARLGFRDETAPIAVGSTLAIAVLATVTGYGIFRYFKVKKVQYNTME